STTGIIAGTAISGTSPGTITVSVNPAVLPPDAATYTGTITITPTSGLSNAPLVIPVTLKVAAVPPVTVSPGSVSLAFQIGGSSNSPQQTLALSTTGVAGVPYTLLTSVDNNPAGRIWFTVSATSGTIPANGSTQLTVTYDTTANLPPNAYTGKITLS